MSVLPFPALLIEKDSEDELERSSWIDISGRLPSESIELLLKRGYDITPVQVLPALLDSERLYVALSRKEFMSLPIETRRRIMEEQAREVVEHYKDEDEIL